MKNIRNDKSSNRKISYRKKKIAIIHTQIFVRDKILQGKVVHTEKFVSIFVWK